MIINSIKIKNFFSIGNVVIDFDEFNNGIIVIDGDNKDTGGKNGVGKSSIIEGICWGLFGKTIRKNTTEEHIVNNHSKKGCEVTITINNNIKIVRSKRPNYLELYINNENKTKESQNETQKYIEELLNTNYKIFLASIVFGQHNSLEFISASSEEKRGIIKNFLNLDDIFKIKENLKVNRINITSNTKVLYGQIEEANKTIKDLTSKLNDLAKGKKLVSTELKLPESQLNDLSLDQIIDIEKSKKFLEGKIKEHRESIEKRRDKKAKLEARIAEYGKQKPCPICSNLYVEGGTDKKLSELQDELTDLAYNLDLSRSTLATVVEQFNAIEIEVTSSQYSAFLEYKNLSSQETMMKDMLNKKKLAVKDLEAKKQELDKKVEIIKFWEIAYSEQGLVKFIIRNILQYFNEKCNYYLSYLSENQFSIQFNDLLEETIYRKDKPSFYSALSGGEKRKIDVAVLLALQSLLILSDKDKSNLLFLDEVADGLDEKSIFGLYSLLNELKKDKLIFVITHNNYLKSLLDETKKIYLINENGITKRI